MTYIDRQTPPREIGHREMRSRRALEAAAAHLTRTARHLACAEPDDPEALRSSLQAIRQAYTALLEWHSLPPHAGASLAELAVPAERLASMLGTCRKRALPLTALERSLGDGSARSVVVREAAQASYYTARNTFAVVLGSLPERVTHEAVRALERAQAIRTGRTAPAPEEQEPGAAAHDTLRKRTHPRPLVTA